MSTALIVGNTSFVAHTARQAHGGARVRTKLEMLGQALATAAPIWRYRSMQAQHAAVIDIWGAYFEGVSA